MKKLIWFWLAIFNLVFVSPAYSADRETDLNTHDHEGPPGAEEADDPEEEDDTICGGNGTGSPVYLANRQLIWQETDVAFPGRPALGLVRTYKSNDSREGIFGKGWTSSCEKRLFKTYDVSSEVVTTQVEGEEEGEAESEVVNSTASIYVYRAANGRTYEYLENEAQDGYIAPDGLKGDLRLEEIAGGAALIYIDGSREEYNNLGYLGKEIDRNGNELVYSYEEGALVRMEDANGRSLSFAYDSAGHVATVTDHTDRVWSYAYSDLGELISVTDPAGGVRTYTYDFYKPLASGAEYSQLSSISDVSGTSIIDITYTEDGKVATYSEGENIFTYTETTSYIDKVDSLGSRWRYWLDDKGRKIQIRDPEGNSRYFEYTDQGSVAKFTDELGIEFTYTYDDQDRITSATTPDGTTTYTYSSAGPWPTSITSPSGRVEQFTYDEAFNLTSMVDPEGFITALSYNSNGDLTSVTNALDQTTTITYSTTGLPISVVDPLGRELKVTYDERGNRISLTNSNGETNGYGFDILNRLTKVTDGLGRETEFAFDAAGRVLAVVAANDESVTYEYDDYGRMVTRTDFDGVIESVTYRTDNLPSETTDKAGVITTYTYDRKGRITNMSVGGLATRYTYGRRGFLTQARNGTGTVSFQYDEMGRMTREDNYGRVDYQYDQEGELVSQTALGRTETFSYNPRGLLKDITTPEGVFDFAYDQLGRRSQLTYPSSDSVQYAYDPAGQLIQQIFAGAFSATFDYGYDQSGRMVSWAGDGEPRSYGYDAASQLKTVTDHLGDYSFTFDSVGNITSDGGIFDSANQLLENTTHLFTYDANGNMLSKTSKESGEQTRFTWNTRNQLVDLGRFEGADATVAITSTTYTYGPLGRRWSRTRDGTVERFVYAGVDLIAITDNRNNPITQYSFGPSIDEPLMKVSADSTSYLYSDYLGSIQAISDGANLTEFNYSAYGFPSASSEDINIQFLYTGREYEGNGIFYYRNRYYDSGLRRFVSSDPIGILAGVNLYRYVSNNPITMLDPFGLWFYSFDDFLDDLNDAWSAGTDWHFEGRDSKNTNLPSYDQAIAPGSGWDLLPQSQSIYHQNNVGKPELKFIHSDGREAVFDGDTCKIVSDPKYRGTFNYVNPAPIPDVWYDVPGWGKFLGFGAGHVIVDVIPYGIGGNVRGPD